MATVYIIADHTGLEESFTAAFSTRELAEGFIAKHGEHLYVIEYELDSES